MQTVTRSFTIIIPHRNTPALLQRCLDSIPVREDVQVIVVDDNSDPNCVDFEHFPQWEGTYYEYHLTKEGKGAGFARNVGLEYAKGVWIIFADADDFFFSHELIRLFELEIPEETSVVLYKFKYFHEDGSFHIYPLIDEHIASERTVLMDCQNTNVLCRDAVMPWAKMVKRELLVKNQIFFDEIKWGNDMIFSTKLSLSVESFSIAPILVYSHEWLPNSLVNKEPGLEMFYRRSLLSLKRAKLLQRGGRLNYNIFTDQWFRRIYSINYWYAVFLRLKCVFELGPSYCFRNWRLFTHKSFYLTRLFIKRLFRIQSKA